MAAGLLGSIAPDLDMIYFYLFDHRQHHHHIYWTHIPFYWMIVLGISFLYIRFVNAKYLPILFVFATNIVFHLFADTIVGDIWWLLPFVDKPYAAFTVPALYKPWWLNFILHWSFLIEIILTFTALYVFTRSFILKKRLRPAIPPGPLKLDGAFHASGKSKVKNESYS